MMPPPHCAIASPVDSAEHGEHETLRQQLHHETSATHSERDAHRDLAPALERARQQEVRDVGARDEQHDHRHAAQPRRDLGFVPRVRTAIAQHRAGERVRLGEANGVVLGCASTCFL